MSEADAQWWDDNVQPVIREDKERVDFAWRWPRMLFALRLVQQLRRRELRGYVVWADAGTRGFVRAAMALAIPAYPHLDVSDPARATFLWFVAAAPPAFLRSLGTSPARLCDVVLDLCMVLSEAQGFGGRIGLHAAPKGGIGLRSFYETSCRLHRLNKKARLPAGVFRTNDGGYFYTDPARASELLTQRDAHR